MKTLVTKVTERGQASIPAFIRNTLQLESGSALVWKIAEDGKAIIVVPVPKMAVRARSARELIGWGRKFHSPRRTEDWMKELREGEQP